MSENWKNDPHDREEQTKLDLRQLQIELCAIQNFRAVFYKSPEEQITRLISIIPHLPSETLKAEVKALIEEKKAGRHLLDVLLDGMRTRLEILNRRMEQE